MTLPPLVVIYYYVYLIVCTSYSPFMNCVHKQINARAGHRVSKKRFVDFQVNTPMAAAAGGEGGLDANPQQVFPVFLGNGKSFFCKLNF